MQLRDLLLETAQYISQCDWDRARPLLEVLSRRVSSTGDSIERVASCFFEALAIRFSKVSGTEVLPHFFTLTLFLIPHSFKESIKSYITVEHILRMFFDDRVTTDSSVLSVWECWRGGSLTS